MTDLVSGDCPECGGMLTWGGMSWHPHSGEYHQGVRHRYMAYLARMMRKQVARMSLSDKDPCLECRHARHQHTGTHASPNKARRELVCIKREQGVDNKHRVCGCPKFIDISYGVKVSGVFDGVLYWVGTNNKAYHRFYSVGPESGEALALLRQEAETHITEHNRTHGHHILR